MEDLEVTGMRVKREPRPKERGAPVAVGKALKLARRMRISILRDGFLFVLTVTGLPRVGRFAADEVGGGDNVDEQEHCEWGILLEEASWKNPCFNLFSFCSNIRHSCEQPNLITQRQGLLKYKVFQISFFCSLPSPIVCQGDILQGEIFFSGRNHLRRLTDPQ